MAAIEKCSIRDTVSALGVLVLEKIEMLAHFPQAWATTMMRAAAIVPILSTRYAYKLYRVHLSGTGPSNRAPGYRYAYAYRLQ